MQICPIAKKNNFIVPVTKAPTFFAAILHLFGQGCQNFNTWDLSLAYNTYAVKFYPDP